jgi:hypothetical protein
MNPIVTEAHTGGDLAMAKEIAIELGNAYPGHPFDVGVSSRTGMVIIQHPALSRKYGVYIRMDEIDTHDALKKKAVWAGGEFLERHGLARGKAVESDLVEKSKRAWFQ